MTRILPRLSLAPALPVAWLLTAVSGWANAVVHAPDEDARMADLMSGMLLGAAVLIGTAVLLVATAILWYARTARREGTK